VVNLTGTFALVALFYASRGGTLLGAEGWALLFLGVIGGYTTFSTFTLETLNFLAEGQWMWGALNVLLNVGGCLLGGWAAMILGLALSRA
jgi:CrcB protein